MTGKKIDFTLPDKLTFKRAEVIKLAKLDGKVLDYWEQEFGCIKPTINISGEKFYTQKDVQMIMRIKQWMIVERMEKTKIKKIISEIHNVEIPEKHVQEKPLQAVNRTDILPKIKKGLEEILTILKKNGKT